MWLSTASSDSFWPLKLSNSSTLRLDVVVVLRFLRELGVRLSDTDYSRSIFVVNVALLGLLQQSKELVVAQLRVSLAVSRGAYAIPHVTITVFVTGRVVAACLIPVDEAAAGESESVTCSISASCHDDLGGLDLDNKGPEVRTAGSHRSLRRLNVNVGCCQIPQPRSCSRLSSTPVAPSWSQAGGLERSKGLQWSRCLLLVCQP
jgi:hypothetical protein